MSLRVGQSLDLIDLGFYQFTEFVYALDMTSLPIPYECKICMVVPSLKFLSHNIAEEFIVGTLGSRKHI